MVTAMMMVVGDHEYEYDDDTSDAGGEHLFVTVSYVCIKAPFGPKHCCTVEGRQNRRSFAR